MAGTKSDGALIEARKMVLADLLLRLGQAKRQGDNTEAQRLYPAIWRLQDDLFVDPTPTAVSTPQTSGESS